MTNIILMKNFNIYQNLWLQKIIWINNYIK